MSLRLRQSLHPVPLRRAFALSWLSLLIGFSSWCSTHPEIACHDLPHLLLAPPASIGPASFGLGTDAFGRALLPLLGRGVAYSGFLSLFATALTLSLGLGFALLHGLGKRALSGLIEKTLQGLLAFPSLLLALLLSALRGPGWSTLFIALLLGTVPGFLRLILARQRELLQAPHIEAARAIGASALRISGRHLLPPLMDLARLKAPALIAHCILAEASLTFLGVGAPRSADTWGSLLLQAKDYLLEAPYIGAVAGVPLFFTLLALQTLTEE